MTSLLLELENVPSPLGFDSWLTFWLILVVSVLNGILMLFSGYKFLQIIQLSGYKLKGYWQWIKDTKASYWWRLVALSLLSSAALLMTNVLLEQFLVYKILTYAGLLFYFLFFLKHNYICFYIIFGCLSGCNFLPSHAGDQRCLSTFCKRNKLNVYIGIKLCLLVDQHLVA